MLFYSNKEQRCVDTVESSSNSFSSTKVNHTSKQQPQESFIHIAEQLKANALALFSSLGLANQYI